MRITVGCKRTEISTQRKWDPARWNKNAGRALGTKEEARSLNSHLDTLQAKVYEAQRQLIADGEPVTLDSVNSRMKGKRQPTRSFIQVFKEHNMKIKSLVDKDYAEGTFKRYETALKHTLSFLNWKYKSSDINITDLNYEFVSELEFWLKSVRNCDRNSAMKYIANIKKIVHVCLKNGWLQRDPFINFKISKREVIRDFLTMEEIILITEKSFVANRLSMVRDIFLFSCYTGLAYADVKKLKTY